MSKVFTRIGENPVLVFDNHEIPENFEEQVNWIKARTEKAIVGDPTLFAIVREPGSNHGSIVIPLWTEKDSRDVTWEDDLKGLLYAYDPGVFFGSGAECQAKYSALLQCLRRYEAPDGLSWATALHTWAQCFMGCSYRERVFHVWCSMLSCPEVLF